jgi:hypothetical protein
LNPQDSRLERLWLGLRTDRGIPEDELTAEARAMVGEWELKGEATVQEGRVRLSPSGWLLLDHRVVELAALLK